MLQKRWQLSRCSKMQSNNQNKSPHVKKKRKKEREYYKECLNLILQMKY